VVALSKLQKQLVAQDPLLITVFEAVGPGRSRNRNDDIYFGLLSAITAQQLSGKAADTIFGRFLDLFPDRYPHPEKILKLTVEQMRSAGLSRQKSEYIRNIARFALEFGISREILDQMADEEVITYLTRIKGVGRWTSEMVLMFGLGRPDVLPIDDLGIQQAMIKLYSFRSKGRALGKRMTVKAEAWRPHRTYVCSCLWRWKDR